jgi:hypothetical protein
VYVSRDLTFGYVEANSRPLTELLDYVKQRDHVLHGVGDKYTVIGVPFAGKLEAARDNDIAFIRGI